MIETKIESYATTTNGQTIEWLLTFTIERNHYSKVCLTKEELKKLDEQIKEVIDKK